MPVLIDLGRTVVKGDDTPLLPTQLWGYDVVKLALIEGSLYLYLRKGEQSLDSWNILNKALHGS